MPDAPLEGWSRFPLLQGFPRSLARGFAGKSALLHLAAVGLTPLLIASGVDAWGRDLFWGLRSHLTLEVRMAIFYAGMAWPIVVGLALARAGFWRRDRVATAAGCAVLQAIIVVGLLTLLLKLATGRPPPREGVDAREFHWLAFDQGHLLVMWPSGHTSESVSAAACLQGFFRGRRPAARWVALGWLAAALVAASMLLGNFHWVSDVVAGALIAFPIGRAIGESFRAWAFEPQAQSAGSSLPSSLRG